DLVADSQPHEREADPPAIKQPLPRLRRVEPPQRVAGAGAGSLVQAAVAFTRERDRATVGRVFGLVGREVCLRGEGGLREVLGRAEIVRRDARELAGVETVRGQYHAEQLPNPL